MAMQWQMAEIFSGVGNGSHAFRKAGFNVCSYDVTCDGTHMNFLSPAGFAPGSESHSPSKSIYRCVLITKKH